MKNPEHAALLKHSIRNLSWKHLREAMLVRQDYLLSTSEESLNKVFGGLK